MTAPRLSVHVVTWNSATVVDACLESLLGQSPPPEEVVVVDNASTDGSAERVESWFRRGLRGTLLRETSNRGFCGAQNRAIGFSGGEWVLFLNPDAVLPPGFLAQASDVLSRQVSNVGSVAPCLLRPDGSVDSTGLVLDRFRRAYDRGRGETSPARYAQEEDVEACTGAVAFHRRAMLEDVALGGAPLDESLFAYYDDLDLSWRARLLGWRCRYVPSLVAVHGRAGRNALRGLGGRKTRGEEQALTVRNRYLVLAKCESVGPLLRDLPWILPFEIARPLFLAARAPGGLRGYGRAAAALPGALRERRRIREAIRRRRSQP
ncbi:MAG TPA: glycosyltransferase family 2 protein [Thermoanaerobaculia bacterium]